MFSLKLEPCLLVIEIPTLPVARVVAFLAGRPQRALMCILLFMTRPAFRLRILVSGGQVTFLALDYLVLAGQRKARLPVVEHDLFPGLLAVACLALFAFLTFVLVIFLVA